jgi:hypothetical protein
MLPQNVIDIGILCNSSPNFLQCFQFCKYSSLIGGHVYTITKHPSFYKTSSMTQSDTETIVNKTPLPLSVTTVTTVINFDRFRYASTSHHKKR